LPEAQLDRFLFDIRIGYPNEEEEVGILRSTTGASEVTLAPVLDAAQTSALQRLTRELPAADPILRYAASLARATRPPTDDGAANGASPPPDLVKRYVRWGAGPRAGQALVLGAKAHALLSGRAAVTPDDVRRVAQPVLRHRVLPNFAADADGVTAEQIVAAVVRHVPAPESGIRV
jgi:MoxR-like ATPase